MTAAAVLVPQASHKRTLFIEFTFDIWKKKKKFYKLMTNFLKIL